MSVLGIDISFSPCFFSITSSNLLWSHLSIVSKRKNPVNAVTNGGKKNSRIKREAVLLGQGPISWLTALCRVKIHNFLTLAIFRWLGSAHWFLFLAICYSHTVFSIDLEVVSQILKVGNMCIANAWRARAPRGVRGYAPPKMFSKKESGDAIWGILGTLRQEKMCNFSVSFCAFFGI